MIELIVVIVILGILGAIAVPGFADVSRNARVAKLQSAEGAVRTGALLANVKQTVDGLGPNTAVDMGGVIVTMQNGFPTGNAAGIGAAANLGVTGHVLVTGGALPPNAVSIRVGGAPNPPACSFTYRGPTGVGGQPTVFPLATSGC